MTEATTSIGIVVTAEQIPLLRDIIVAHQLDIYISDTQDTLLLDDQWKPWIRRVRPQRAHCQAAVWLIAPCYSWPNQDSHPRIRQIIAEQLQSCIQMAVLLGATGLVLPLEHAHPAFYVRLTYYLNLINDQLNTHNLSLKIGVTADIDANEVMQFLEQSTHTYPLLVALDGEHIELHNLINSPCYWQINADEMSDTPLPTRTTHYVVSANDNVSLIRKKVLWIREQIANQQQSIESPTPDATLDAESLISTDDEIT
jgi:hypothetical protein